MTLEQYRIKRRFKIGELADALEVDRTTVWRWLNRKAIPNAQAILRIKAWSRGAVQPNDWITGVGDE